MISGPECGRAEARRSEGGVWPEMSDPGCGCATVRGAEGGVWQGMSGPGCGYPTAIELVGGVWPRRKGCGRLMATMPEGGVLPRKSEPGGGVPRRKSGPGGGVRVRTGGPGGGGVSGSAMGRTTRWRMVDGRPGERRLPGVAVTRRSPVGARV
ncbi:hypothetical protein [Nonomuraea glycinis]|uniref:hypothetical protein n=1 Tax=Nonomuraea glycinis TaxID=2047744 RepID=UPI002E1065CB|nr:hypothetical protein OHA68_44325 [Nonomuraea glycinis]